MKIFKSNWIDKKLSHTSDHSFLFASVYSKKKRKIFTPITNDWMSSYLVQLHLKFFLFNICSVFVWILRLLVLIDFYIHTYIHIYMSMSWMHYWFIILMCYLIYLLWNIFLLLLLYMLVLNGVSVFLITLSYDLRSHINQYYYCSQSFCLLFLIDIRNPELNDGD